MSLQRKIPSSLTEEQTVFLSQQLIQGMIKSPEQYDMVMGIIQFINEEDGATQDQPLIDIYEQLRQPRESGELGTDEGDTDNDVGERNLRPRDSASRQIFRFK